MATIKTTCTRCGGSGSFSFNLVHGTTCYGCRGAGFVIVDAKAHVKKLAAQAKRDAERAATKARREELAAIVWQELDEQFGPFASDARGAEALVQACQRALGKTPGEIVSERMRVAA